VIGQTGLYENIINWVNQAWVEIQGLHDNWMFMRANDSFPCVTATRDYTLDPVPKRVEPHSVIATDSSGDSHEVELVDWSTFQDAYRTYKVEDDQAPRVCTITPAGQMRFLDYTDPDYTISYEFGAKPVPFAAGTDQPTLPEEFDDVIVFKALIDYGLFYNAQEAMQHGQMRYTDLIGRLRENQLIRPHVRLGGFVRGRNVGVSRFI
jgi:hypothetical protein